MRKLLNGKTLLIVDDEPDLLDLVVEDFPECVVDTARSYAEGREKLANGRYDAVILDVSGVQGFDLLAEFKGKAPCIMLTAHALAPEDLARAIEGGAALYLPKEEIAALDEFLERVFSAKGPLWTWLEGRIDRRRWFGGGPAAAAPGRPSP
jgi:DNA-binding response OmpR family regulator